jgi:hypothetical protein
MKREDKAIQQILKGQTPDKKVQVSMWNPNTDKVIIEERKKNAKDKAVSEEKADILRSARMPMFCPTCGFIMNKEADKKMWARMQKCLDCVVTEENRHKLDGTWDAYEKEKVLKNKRSWIIEQLQSIVEWRKAEEVKFLNQINPDGHSVEEEKWDMNTDSIKKMADKATKEYKKMLSEVNSELSEF